MQNFQYERRKKRRLKPITVFLLSLFATLVMSGSYLYYSYQQDYQARIENAKIYGRYFSQKTSLVMENLSQSLYILSSIIRWQNGKTDYYEELAGYLIKIIPETININLAKDGIVSHVYPYEQNKFAIGHNLLLSQARRDEALKTLLSRKVTVAGPLLLIQGGRGIAFRQAVFLPNKKNSAENTPQEKLIIQKNPQNTEANNDDRFWGFVIITYDFPKIMQRLNYEELTLAGLSWNLWHISPRTGQKESIISSGTIQKNQVQTFSIPLQNATWFLDVSPKASAQNHKFIIETFLYVFICLLLSLLCTFIFILNNKNKIIERQSNTDTLTNLPNRKCFYTLLKNALQNHFNTVHAEDEPVLHLCILDLNDFKQINDKYGHIIGDKILIEFSRRLSESHLPDEFASRLGGDEFLAVYYCTPSKENEIPKRLADILDYLQQPYTINEKVYTVTASLGFICPSREMLNKKPRHSLTKNFFLIRQTVSCTKENANITKNSVHKEDGNFRLFLCRLQNSPVRSYYTVFLSSAKAVLTKSSQKGRSKLSSKSKSGE